MSVNRFAKNSSANENRAKEEKNNQQEDGLHHQGMYAAGQHILRPGGGVSDQTEHRPAHAGCSHP